MNEYLLFGGGLLGVAWMIRMHVKRAFAGTAEEPTDANQNSEES